MRRSGDHTRRRIRRPCDRDRVWQSMRVMRTFSQPELVATAEAGRENVRRYVRGLLNAGYLAVVRPTDSGRRGGHAVYRLVRDTGPHAPRLRVDGRTYDVNKRAVFEGGVHQ